MPKTPYRIRLFTVAAAFVGLMSAGCSSDSYDTGDGNYSYLTADFAIVPTDASAGQLSPTPYIVLWSIMTRSRRRRWRCVP